MKNLIILISIILLLCFSACTADELPETSKTLQTDTIDDVPPKVVDTDPPPIIIKK